MKSWSVIVLAAAMFVATPCFAYDALREYARRGDLANVQAELDRGEDPNDYNNTYSPLMFAAGQGHTEVVRLLLKHGAKTEYRDHNGDRALLWAARDGHLEVVRLLLDAGSPPDSDDDPYQRTPLMLASQYGRDEIAGLLLDRGADVRRMDHTNETALHEAASGPSAALVARLLRAGADPSAVGDYLLETPLHNAAQYDRVETVRLLTAAGAKTELRDYKGRTPLWLAASMDYAPTVEALLAAGADPDARGEGGETPFVTAAAKSGAAARLLVDRTAAIDEAVVAAVWGGHLDLAKRLVTRGAGVNGGRDPVNPALAATARHPGLEMLEWLLAQGADVQLQGGAAMAEAGRLGRADIVERLMAAGVAPDARAANGVTALLMAAGEGRVEVVRLLLSRGADPKAKDAAGRGIEDYMTSTTAAISGTIEQRGRSRAWRPTEHLEKELARLEAAHAQIRTLLAPA